MPVNFSNESAETPLQNCELFNNCKYNKISTFTFPEKWMRVEWRGE